MSGETGSIADIERHRLLLEENIKQLRKAIQHWQTWDAEYEALKEEVDSVATGGSKELERIKNDFDGELIDQKEIDEIFGRQKPKTRSQIVNVLDRRIDYVTKSLESLGKQLEAAEDSYANATVVSEPDDADEGGQPVTEILEELDEDDNVLSFKLNTPGQALPHIQETLDKVGLKDFLEEDKGTNKVSPEQEAQKDKKPAAQIAQPKAPAQRKPSSQHEAAPKKAVSFVDEQTLDADEPKPEMSRKAKRVEHIMKNAKEQENISKTAPVVPEDEDEDEAALRKDMLKYSMGEVGAVVAELELEEGDSDDYEFDYTDEDDEDDDDEDKYGRTKQRVVTDDYRQRMLELEKKLGIKSRFTDAAAAEDEDEGLGSGSDDERIGRIVVSQNPAPGVSALKPTPTKSSIKERQGGDSEGKKGVRFADNLDIAPEDEAVATTAPKKEDLVEPLSDVVERSSGPGTSEPKPARKPSRFKKARNETSDSPGVIKGPLDAPAKFLDQQDSQPLPTGPDGTTLADKLVEREATSGPVETGDFDSSAFHEVADEHQRLRKKFIERQGGFLKEDESPIKPLDEADGGPERMSRFKAARLSRQ